MRMHAYFRISLRLQSTDAIPGHTGSATLLEHAVRESVSTVNKIIRVAIHMHMG